MCAAAGLTALFFSPVMLFAHREGNKKGLLPTKYWLCFDVYDEPVIISACSSRHSHTLPFSFSQRWGGIQEISHCPLVPQFIIVKKV